MSDLDRVTAFKNGGDDYTVCIDDEVYSMVLDKAKPDTCSKNEYLGCLEDFDLSKAGKPVPPPTLPLGIRLGIGNRLF